MYQLVVLISCYNYSSVVFSQWQAVRLDTIEEAFIDFNATLDFHDKLFADMKAYYLGNKF